MHYYTFNIGDYRRQTGHLTLVEHGIYRSLLDTYYLTEQPLTSDVQKLMRSHSIRTADEKQALLNVLDDFFYVTDEGYRQKSCDEQIAKFQVKSEKARKSANARWNNANASRKDANASKAHTDSKADELLDACEADATQEPRTKNQEPETKNQSENTPSANADDVQVVFAYWVETMGKNSNVKLTNGRRAKIKSRLKSYPVDFIKQAITNCARSEYHMGANAQGTVYDDLELICRSDEKLEWFANNVGRAPTSEQAILDEQDAWVNGTTPSSQGDFIEGEFLHE